MCTSGRDFDTYTEHFFCLHTFFCAHKCRIDHGRELISASVLSGDEQERIFTLTKGAF